MNKIRLFRFSLLLSCVTITNVYGMLSKKILLAATATVMGGSYVGYNEYKYAQIKNQLKAAGQNTHTDMFNEPYYSECTKDVFRTAQKESVIKTLKEQEEQLKHKALVSRFFIKD